ncbi:MAG: glycoside hydrolase family 2 TIM barrel-domain containing protein [Ginsengibacter sp.]
MVRKLIVFVCLLCGTIRVYAQINTTTLFDNNWTFLLGGAQGAEDINFNDSSWRKIDLPHDWSIEDLKGTNSPFNKYAISQVSGGFTTGGTGWYRKKFLISSEDKGKKIFIQFDGVYMNADVWINGHHLGNHPYGYTCFIYDLTNYLKYDSSNVIAVEVKNEGQNSRWYSGSGIYRHVWLKKMDLVHVSQWGIFITTPEVNSAVATINCKTNVVNESKQPQTVRIVTRLINPEGKEVATANEARSALAAGKSFEFNQNTSIKNPELWSCESPVLYKAITSVYKNDQLVSSDTNGFGIRKISFDVNNGFQLNGKTLKLKGGCFHNDDGPLGSKQYDRAEERKVELLKASGFNAIRCSHNPPSPAFLEACDRLGMLVMDEAFDCWNYGKNPYDYHLYFKDWWKKDVESMVLRDRNHPSIIMWSIGNEIPERATAEGVATAKLLVNYIKSLDTTRAITSAVNDLKEDKDPYFAQLDVAGYNYAANGNPAEDVYAKDHKRVPGRIMVGTESFPLEAFDSWMKVLDHPYVIGDFVWTAYDYVGEASIGWLGYFQKQSFFPWNLAYCGDIDICGWKRPQSYYRDALWKKDQISLFVTPPVPTFPENPDKEPWSKWNWLDAQSNWNWEGHENEPLEVTVYSSCPHVELFLNGKSLGKKPTDRSTKYMASWKVSYQKGELKAVGYDSKNKIINAAQLTTASTPETIKLTADRTVIKANNQDLSYVTVELLDANGNLNPTSENLIKFKIDGPGTIAGVGNANPISLESYQQPQRKAWHGKCLVIIKSGNTPGKITLTASGANMKSASINVNVE